MPVRSLNSAVLKWPDAEAVQAAAEAWARGLAERDAHVQRVGYFGSYATDSWGVGNDVDLVVVCTHCALPITERGAAFAPSGLPVPADVLVYSEAEFAALLQDGSRMGRELRDAAVWVYERRASVE